jgi:hypothetical protein
LIHEKWLSLPMHAAEHKGQISTILKQKGSHLDLDALDLWQFIAETKI